MFSDKTNRAILIFLVMLSIASLTLSFLSHISSGDVNLWSWADGAFQNFGTEMLGAIATFILFEILLEGNRRRQEEKKQLAPVDIVLQSGDNKVKLPVSIPKNQLSRPEILGRIGMLPTKNSGHRFSLSYLQTPEFLQQILEIQTSTAEMESFILTVPCTDEELNQFDF